MNREELKTLLLSFHRGELTLNEVVEKITLYPFQPSSFARLDTHRELRRGFPEVIFGLGKSKEQFAAIFEAMAQRLPLVMATKVSPEQAKEVVASHSAAEYQPLARTLVLDKRPPQRPQGLVAIISAGTSDLPVAEEAAVTARVCRVRLLTFYDIGVAGLHRLVHVLPKLRRVHACVVVAGMEGALPSVVGGLIPAPIIAVPTSVGYGSHQGGMVPLLTMLNSCVPGIAVVNIDNGFGAAYFAALVAKRRCRGDK